MRAWIEDTIIFTIMACIFVGFIFGMYFLSNDSRTGCFKPEPIKTNNLFDYDCNTLMQFVISKHSPVEYGEYCDGVLTNNITFNFYDMRDYYREECVLSSSKQNTSQVKA